jgi:hypothetical protein
VLGNIDQPWSNLAVVDDSCRDAGSFGVSVHLPIFARMD